MSLIKKLIQRLLDSRTTPEEAGHSAMPGASSTTLLSNTAVNDWGTVSTGVAADDGYLVLTARNAGNEGASLSLKVGGVARQSLTYPFIGAGGNAFVPIGKGDSWALIGSSSDSITLRLYKTIGGGYQALKKLLLQGGGLCRLSHWYSSLRRSSCRVRKNGCSKTLSPLKETQLLSQIKDRVLHLLRTLLRQTDCLEFGIKQVRGISLHCLAIATVTEEIRPDGNFLRLTDGQLKTHFMYLREKSLNLIQTATRQVLPECGSTRRLNSAVGGASC